MVNSFLRGFHSKTKYFGKGGKKKRYAFNCLWLLVCIVWAVSELQAGGANENVSVGMSEYELEKKLKNKWKRASVKQYGRLVLKGSKYRICNYLVSGIKNDSLKMFIDMIKEKEGEEYRLVNFCTFKDTLKYYHMFKWSRMDSICPGYLESYDENLNQFIKD